MNRPDEIICPAVVSGVFETNENASVTKKDLCCIGLPCSQGRGAKFLVSHKCIRSPSLPHSVPFCQTKTSLAQMLYPVQITGIVLH